MIAFWVIAALLVAGALLFALFPLLGRRHRETLERETVNVAIYRDELEELKQDLSAGTLGAEQYEAARSELQRRVLDDVPPESSGPRPALRHSGRWMGIAAAVIIPVFAVGLYLKLGNLEALEPRGEGARGNHGAGQITPEQVAAMVENLAARLKTNPSDAQGWIVLARSYTVLGRFAEAAVAYGNATSLISDDAQLWADYADIAAMAQGKRLQGVPADFIRKALALDPQNHKALALAGSAAFEAKDYPAAINYWKQLIKLVPEGSREARSVSGAIADAMALAGGGRPPAATDPESPRGDSQASASGGGRVAGVVSLSSKLASQAQPEDTVFVFARAAKGPRMPLAILKLRAKDLPAGFVLDDSLAMAPEMRLSNFAEVVVGARVSRSGNATPQSGDLQGAALPVKIGAKGVRVVIDHTVP